MHDVKPGLGLGVGVGLFAGLALEELFVDLFLLLGLRFGALGGLGIQLLLGAEQFDVGATVVKRRVTDSGVIR
jgi:hypothetical protein